MFRQISSRIRLPRNSRDLLHAANLRHGTDGFTSPPKEGVLRIYISLISTEWQSKVNSFNTKQHSPSSEANRFSASQEILSFYGTRRFIIAFTSARCLSLLWIAMYQMISPSSKSREIFRNIVSVLRRGVVGTSHKSKAGGPPLFAVRDWLLSIFAATLHIWRPFFYPQPEYPLNVTVGITSRCVSNWTKVDRQFE